MSQPKSARRLPSPTAEALFPIAARLYCSPLTDTRKASEDTPSARCERAVEDAIRLWNHCANASDK